MAIGRITYEDKIDSSVNEQDPKHKITAQDMNEIKQVFNESAEDIEFATENLGDYKVENGVIYFKKADGSYNEQGVSLAGQSTILDGDGNVILSGNITPNDNLLTNSDFRKGVINQNGQTSYTGVLGRAIYGIDRWFIADNTNNKVNVYDGYVAFTLANGSSINQYVYRFDENETNYTFAIKLKNSEVKVIHLTTNNTTGTLLQDNIYVVLRNFTGDDNPNNDFQLYFENRSGATKTLNIEYMKLEKGLYFTGMPMWDYTKEVSSAHRKMIGLDSIQGGEVSIGTANFFNTEVWIMIPLTNYFDKKPTVYTTGTIKLILDGYDEATITNLSVIAFSNQSAIVKGTLSKSLSSHNGKIGRVIMTTGSRIVFDGNDY